MSMEDRLHELADLKNQKEVLDAELKDKSAQVKKMEEVVYEMFVLEGITSMKTSRGNFGARVNKRFSIKKESKEETMDAIRKHFPDLVVETVNAQTLSAFMREAESEGTEIPEEITAGLSSYEQIGITWRRS